MTVGLREVTVLALDRFPFRRMSRKGCLYEYKFCEVVTLGFEYIGSVAASISAPSRVFKGL